MTTWMALTGEDPLQLVHIRDGAYAFADMRDGFRRLIVIEGEFERDFFRIADSFLRPGGTFLDVGANHGLLSFGVAGRLGTNVDIHIFEPNPGLVKSIERSLQRYPSARMRINACAVTEHDGTVTFEIDAERQGNSHIVRNGGTRVAATTIDTYLNDAKIAVVDLMKVDVEGFELHVFRGSERALRERRVRAIYFECTNIEEWSTRAGTVTELLDFLADCGYTVCFCAEKDLQNLDVRAMTLRDELPGRGLRLIPVRGHPLPRQTDLLAVPSDNLHEWM